MKCVRVFQKDRAEGLQVRVPGRQELSGGQAPTEQMSVLSVSEVPAGRYGQGGRTYGFAEGSPGSAAVQAQVVARVATQSAGVAHHRARPCQRRHKSRFLVFGLFTSNGFFFFFLALFNYNISYIGFLNRVKDTAISATHHLYGCMCLCVSRNFSKNSSPPNIMSSYNLLAKLFINEHLSNASER